MSDLPEFALSIRQPWCWAILTLGKDIENRDWPTKFRGPVCVHASKAMTWDEYWGFSETALSIFNNDLALPERKSFQRGGVVGVVEIVDCVSDHRSPWFFGDYGFVLANPRAVPFVAVKGSLGFFRWRNNLALAP